MIETNEIENNLPLYVWAIPISYFIIFEILYERKFFRKRINAKSSKYFFDALTPERSVIRFEYVEKFHRYSILAVFLVGIFVSMSLYFTIQEQNSHYQEYVENNNTYQQKIKETYQFSEKQLREHFHSQIEKMTTLEVDRRIVSVTGNERYGSSNNATFAEFHMPGNAILANITSDIDRKNYLHSKYDSMTFKELEEILSKQLTEMKPNVFDYNFRDNTFIEFLIFVWILSAVAPYMILPLKHSLTRHIDFYYFLSKACFQIIGNVAEIDEMKKRKYMLMGLQYYEKYIKKNTSMNIHRFGEIKSRFVNYNSEQLSMIAVNFLESLETKNKLKLLNFIQNKIQVSDPSQFLIHVTFSDKIKDNWKIVATGITALLQITILLVNLVYQQSVNSGL